MTLPLMPKATAVWMVENTKLTFEQIGDFCGMHPLEVQGIADGEVAVGIIGQDPVAAQQLTTEELEKAEADSGYRMKLSPKAREHTKQKTKGARYTPIARRQDKPEAIAWLIKQHPYIPDSQIIKLIGTTKKTIESIRDRSHWNISNIKGKDPVMLGLCTQTALNATVEKYRPKAPEQPPEEQAVTAQADDTQTSESA